MGWNDVKPQNNGDNTGDGKPKINYAQMPARKEGYAIRILDEQPRSRWTHWIPSANKGKGISVDCPGKDCPICALIKEAKKAKKQASYNSRKMHAINILNRETNQVEVLDKGNGLFEQLLDVMSEVGDLRNYDIKLKVSGEGRDTSYTPIPMPAKALTADEKTLEKYDLETLNPILDKDQITALMNGASFVDLFGTGETQEDGDAVLQEEQPEVDFTKS